jgi:DNA replication protein DnaC
MAQLRQQEEEMSTLSPELQAILDRMKERADTARQDLPDAAALEAQRLQDQATARITASLIPPRFVGSSFLEYHVEAGNQKAYDVAKEWSDKTAAETKGEGFFLLGEPGTGKTHLVCSAAMQRIANGQNGVRYLNVPIFLDRIRASFKFTESAPQDLFEYACTKASLILLDDFGKEKATDWATERLYVLVESRYQNMLPILVTSNRTLDELDALGYGATVSRLQQMCRTIKLETKDHRPASKVKG